MFTVNWTQIIGEVKMPALPKKGLPHLMIFTCCVIYRGCAYVTLLLRLCTRGPLLICRTSVEDISMFYQHEHKNEQYQALGSISSENENITFRITGLVWLSSWILNIKKHKLLGRANLKHWIVVEVSSSVNFTVLSVVLKNSRLPLLNFKRRIRATLTTVMFSRHPSESVGLSLNQAWSVRIFSYKSQLPVETNNCRIPLTW
jgi:hypothetical protein